MHKAQLSERACFRYLPSGRTEHERTSYDDFCLRNLHKCSIPFRAQRLGQMMTNADTSLDLSAYRVMFEFRAVYPLLSSSKSLVRVDNNLYLPAWCGANELSVTSGAYLLPLRLDNTFPHIRNPVFYPQSTQGNHQKASQPVLHAFKYVQCIVMTKQSCPFHFQDPRSKA